MKKLVFTPLDILAPWLVCLLSAGLCTWGAVAAIDVPAKIVSAVTGLVFVLGIPVFYIVRGRRRTPNFETRGMGVVWGTRNKPSKELVEMWVRGLIDFWLGKNVMRTHAPDSAVTITQSMVDRALEGLLVIRYDADHFSFWGRMVRGYASGKTIGIGFKGEDMTYTASLFKHEVSHQILDVAGVLWDETRHHNVFLKTGLGA